MITQTYIFFITLTLIIIRLLIQYNLAIRCFHQFSIILIDVIVCVLD